MPSPLDHYRPTTDDPTDGEGRGESAPVYRVVGTGDPLALLRVTDGSGRRVSCGELRRVSRDTLEAAWEPAPDPDAELRPIRAVWNALTGLFWQFRRFL